MAFFHSVHTKGGQCVRRLLFVSTFVAVVSESAHLNLGNVVFMIFYCFSDIQSNHHCYRVMGDHYETKL